MVDVKVKLTYVALQRRVRCEFTKQDCDARLEPPADIIERTKAKLQSEQTAGEIAVFQIFRTRLNIMWQMLRDSKESRDTKVAVLVGAGSPAMPGLMVTKGRSPTELGRMTITAAPSAAVSWKPYFLKLMVEHQMRGLGENRPVNPVQMIRIWLRAMGGIPIADIPLVATPNPPRSDNKDQMYAILEEEQSRDIMLFIYNVNGVANPEVWAQIKREMWARVDSKNVNGTVAYHFLSDELLGAIRTAESGPEHFGLDLPLILLAAIDEKYYKNGVNLLKTLENPGAGRSSPGKASGQPAKSQVPPQKDKASGGAGQSANSPAPVVRVVELAITVSSNKLRAVIDGFGANADRPQPRGVTIEWLKNQLSKRKFTPEATTTCLLAIADKLSQPSGSNSIVGMPVALGINPVPGEQPFLRIADSAEKKELPPDEFVDVRTAQKQTFVNAGQFIAEIAFKIPGTSGIDIFGATAKFADDSKVKVVMGEGVVEKSPGNFYAIWDGTPACEGLKISVAKGLVHKGDVNLATGNIVFDGPIQITGSIDAGATVESTGDLNVLGSIGAAQIYCRGSLTVAGGINTGTKGLVKAKGLISAKFVENSRLFSGANITITGAATNSEISASGIMTAKNIIGCELQLTGNLVCQNIGKEGARATTVHLGGGKKMLVRTQIQTQRLAKLVARRDEIFKQISLLSKKGDQQKSLKHREAEDHLLVRARRMTELVARVEILLQAAKFAMVLSDKSTVQVSGVLFSGTVIHIGKHKVRIADSIAEVCVSSKTPGGIVIRGIDEAAEAK
jgi:uncharacterized protein (DUF342 family)